MWDMDALASSEVYIPKEAEVKTIPLWSLPKYTLRRIGLAQPDGDGSKNLSASPKATWISPAVIRERGRPLFNHAGDKAKVSMTSLLKKELETVQHPIHMPFVSCNCTAYNVLKEFLPTRRISRQPTQTSLLPHGSPPGTQQDAVIIYGGRIYLSIRKPRLVRGQGETHKFKPIVPAPATQSQQVPLRTSSPPVSSPSTSKIQKMSRPASPEPENDEFVKEKGSLKRRCLTNQAQVTLPKLTPEDLKRVVAKTQVRFTREALDPKPELFYDTVSKRKCDRGKDDIKTQDEDQSMNQEADAPSSNTAHSVPSQEVDSLISKTEREDSGEEQVTDDNNTPSWALELPLVPTFTSNPVQHQDFDFEQLAQEEKIAQMKAKLRASEAALNNLRPSK